MRALGLWTPVLAWMGVLFAASAQSDIGAFGRVPDWMTHGSAYAVLGVLLSRALAGGIGRGLSWRQALLVVALATAYGVSDEFHQSFVPGRDPSALDALKDLGGSAVGAWAFAVASRVVGDRIKENR